MELSRMIPLFRKKELERVLINIGTIINIAKVKERKLLEKNVKIPHSCYQERVLSREHVLNQEQYVVPPLLAALCPPSLKNPI